MVVDPRSGVEVVLPQRAGEAQAASAVVELRPWIERRLAEQAAVLARMERPAGTVPYLGTDLVLREERGRTRAHRRGDVLLVPEAGAVRRSSVAAAKARRSR